MKNGQPMEHEHKNIVISLGGSLIVPNKVDLLFLEQFRTLILRYIQSGNRVVVVCGGGSIAREYQKIARTMHSEVSDQDLDWLGIRVTRLNAELVKIIFGEFAFYKIVKEPDRISRVNDQVIVAAGWKPGWSTDYVAAKCAQVLGAREVINMSNVDYVYDKDPKEFPDARKLEHVSLDEMIDIVGTEWVPGQHSPFDPIATQLSADLKLKVVFLHGTIQALEEYLFSGKVSGTVIE